MSVNITWSHQWSSSDDGTILYGADLGAVQTDIEAHSHTETYTQFTSLTDVSITTSAQGDIIYYNGSKWVALAAGTAGYILKTQGAGANPVWLNVLPIANGGTGKITADWQVKGWIQFNGTGTIAIQDSYNVTSITDNGTGDYTVTWDTDFANDDYCVIPSAISYMAVPYVGGVLVGSTRLAVSYPSGTTGQQALVDVAGIFVMAIGDQ